MTGVAPSDIACHVCGAKAGQVCWPLERRAYCRARIDTAAQLTADQAVYGNCFVTADGHRLDPRRMFGLPQPKEDPVEDATNEVRRFAVQAAESTGQIPLAALQTALDEIDGELGQRMLLPEDQRPEDTPELVRDVRAVRALQRYRLALEGIAS